jgi:hypothetical protein
MMIRNSRAELVLVCGKCEGLSETLRHGEFYGWSYIDR